jgi:putative tributyrin esterase
MALLTVDLFSESLEMGTSLTVVLPQAAEGQIGVEPIVVPEHGWPVLYLLHGLSDDHTAWLRYTSIERHARAAGLAVVMPAAGRSFYTDEVRGYRWWTWISDELPRRVSELFRVSERPEDTYVAGLSMGGYGAMKWALREPERFAAAATLSGALDLAYIQEHDRRPHIRALVARVFADRIVAGGDEDLMHLVRVADPSSLPRLMLRCGRDDHLVAQNRRFVAACTTAGVALDAAFEPGEHTWQFWDRHIQAVLEWMVKR